VFVVQHSYEKADGSDEVKFIGVYCSRDSAQAAVGSLIAEPGFVDHAEGFFIDEYRLDETHWKEGFGTV
jgi:hypothetical protein